ncbi:hypothetical protein BO70DRAFT_359036 [Aspergillus heteromorphus CBS 117.55]|uniref:Ubiquitin-like domain-containing protein n=1 Tax=Aspergillus heteromorphus CBS 117.55 TaxID=1448321 RepID=A0A317WVE1_9EURO|nr:uncharacterized protein BO70DRAFT_359036 [Aspergillus heteromorphus CBS 117.55]PWY90045.1 hypothetical protein BO70DRAFT_359036 [Aspergillus heteromorphus CBS 117.55]
MASVETPEPPRSFVLHVLCPSLPPPNKFSLEGLSPSSTVAALKARISQTIPSEPSPESQRLIYRGKPLINDVVTLRDVLEPANESEYSIHLVLPPAPTPHASSSASAPATTPAPAPAPAPAQAQAPRIPGIPVFAHSPFSPTRLPPQFPAHGQELRYRGPMPSAPHEAEIGLALRRNIEAIRRQIDMQERGAPLGGASEGPGTTRHTTGHLSSSSESTVISHFSTTTTGTNNLPEEIRMHLQLLRHQISFNEDQLNRGVAPPMDHIIRIRTQLFTLLDEQYQNPLTERDGSIESLLTRVFNIYTRADQLRVSHARTTLAPSVLPLYLLSSPTGYQALIATPQGAATMQPSLDAIRAMHASAAVPRPAATATTTAGPELHNANAVVMENMVRQAVLNQRVENNGQFTFARTIRRIWLFVRLYFFCYMFSEPGTWTRVLFVALAVLTSLLSETGVPQQLYRVFVAPVQQHLEGLVHFAPEPAPAPHGTQPTDRANAPPLGLLSGVRHQIRRVERSLALFLASLVPGVGERHVEVRNAAEAARIAEREQEERRQEEAARDGEGAEAVQAQENGNANANGERPVENAAHTPTGEN